MMRFIYALIVATVAACVHTRYSAGCHQQMKGRQ